MTQQHQECIQPSCPVCNDPGTSGVLSNLLTHQSGTQVVSDIDDTLMCSGGHFPAGSDLCYPRGCVYPGVLAFYRGLDAAFAAKVLVSHQS